MADPGVYLDLDSLTPIAMPEASELVLVAIEDHDYFRPLGIYDDAIPARLAVERFVGQQRGWRARPWMWSFWDGIHVYRQERHPKAYHIDYHEPIYVRTLKRNELVKPDGTMGR